MVFQAPFGDSGFRVEASCNTSCGVSVWGKATIKRIEKIRFWLSFLSHLEAVFVHVDVNFWLRRGFAFDALLGALVFLLGSLAGEKTALISCIVSLRLFSSANALHGVLVTFRGPFWDLFIVSRIPPDQGRKHSTASWTQRARRSELDAASPCAGRG